MFKDIFVKNSNVSIFMEQNDIANAARLLLKNQKIAWDDLAAGYHSLSSVKEKTFEFDGFTIRVQSNPGRIKSSAANVDPKFIRERKCFLCPSNLPEKQKGLPYMETYLILGNPYPIFPEHFTLPRIDHIPQTIQDHFDAFLSFAKDLSEYYTVFYNGPKCGASAPDHMHFQAGSKNFIPIEKEFVLLKEKYGDILSRSNDLIVAAVDDGLRKFISIEGRNEIEITNMFDRFYENYKKINPDTVEPLMNILCSYDEKKPEWRIIIFVREKHRPSHYNKEGKEKIVVSPAAVDLGGVIITPRAKDFEKLNKEIIREIFNEVTLGDEQLNLLKESLRK